MDKRAQIMDKVGVKMDEKEVKMDEDGANAEFKKGIWQDEINVRDFIVLNYTPYDGDESFLKDATEKTKKLFEKIRELMVQERKNGGILGVDTKTISNINAYEPGYIEKELESIVGLQTSKPLIRAIMPYGGIRMVKNSLKAYNLELDPKIEEIFTHRKTHNDGVFDVYTPEMKKARHCGIITGLPDAYGRGRIIGDYRRVPLYGVNRLIKEKQKGLSLLEPLSFDEQTIKQREELSEQIKALNSLKEMAKGYGFDISNPAKDTKEAIQWLYFAYLAAVKDQNGAAMSLGRVSTFLDIYAEKDLKQNRYTEEQIQEFVDHFVMKLRLVKFLRTPEYDELFSGDPTWITEAIGGVCLDGRHMVTKMSFRFLHTLKNLGPAPEPNLTILWSLNLPKNFKLYASKVSIRTCAIQYENDDVMRVELGDDYAIACCVSPMRVGKQMQFFGARCNLAKALLYAINGGQDEVFKDQVGPKIEKVKNQVLSYDEVVEKFLVVLDWLAALYVNTLNVIHYMHDKYCYEKIQMALHDDNITRTMACGIAGLSVVADSLSAIKYAKVYPVFNEEGIVVDFKIEGDYPKFGNNDKRVDDIAVWVEKEFMNRLKKQKTYRNSIPTMSILTITSNVVYGKKTGSTPDGRKKGVPFAPGANPMHGRDKNGAVAALKSVSKLPFDFSQDGISYTFSMTPNSLGKEEQEKKENLSYLLDGYFKDTGHHVNINILNRETLEDAMQNPEKYPSLTIRVSGYAVNFIKLTKEQQQDVISRTFHSKF